MIRDRKAIKPLRDDCPKMISHDAFLIDYAGILVHLDRTDTFGGDEGWKTIGLLVG